MYDSYEALLADENVEVVALGGYYTQRGAMAVQALQAGKHVVADKPLCTDLETLAEIEKLAREKNKKVSCMFGMRYDAKALAVAELYKSGALGEVNNIVFGGQHPLQYGRRPGWYYEEGKHGGVINDIAIHAIDMLTFAFDFQEFDVLAARCWNKYADKEPQFQDSAQFMLKAPNGAGIMADVSYASPDGIEFNLPQYWQFTIWGTNGVLEYSHHRDIVFYQKGNMEPIAVAPIEPGKNFAEDFLAMVKGEETLLSMEEVFHSTRETLKIQVFADQHQ